MVKIFSDARFLSYRKVLLVAIIIKIIHTFSSQIPILRAILSEVAYHSAASLEITIQSL